MVFGPFMLAFLLDFSESFKANVSTVYKHFIYRKSKLIFLKLICVWLYNIVYYFDENAGYSVNVTS